jgi:hypothetical protein
MYPEDRVLIGVVRRLRDLRMLRQQHWYRIPQQRMPHGIDADVLGFFVSGRAGVKSGIYFYARPRGVELCYRRDLLPDEPDHPHADHPYYRVALGDIHEKTPPVLNDEGWRFAFLHTTWERFERARVLRDLFWNESKPR